MKRTLVLLATAAMASLSFAQPTVGGIDATGLRLRLGAVYPLEGATRKITGNMLAIGLDFPVRSLAKTGEAYLSADWYGKSGSGAKGNIFPVLYNQRINVDKDPEATQRTYIMVGAGIAHIDVKKAKTAYAMRFALGKELSDTVFAEGGLLWTTDGGGVKGNAFGFFLGYRF